MELLEKRETRELVRILAAPYYAIKFNVFVSDKVIGYFRPYMPRDSGVVYVRYGKAKGEKAVWFGFTNNFCREQYTIEAIMKAVETASKILREKDGPEVKLVRLDNGWYCIKGYSGSCIVLFKLFCNEKHEDCEVWYIADSFFELIVAVKYLIDAIDDVWGSVAFGFGYNVKQL